MASRDVPLLIQSCDDPSPEVARAAIARLTELEGHRAAAALRSRLLDADLSLTADIARALRRVGDSCANEVALEGLRDQRYTRRLAAARALGALGEASAVDALRQTLNDPIAAVRVAALGALADTGAGADAAANCARLLSDQDANVRIAAVRAVARTAARPGALLADAARDPDWLVRLEVARHLAGLPERAAACLLADHALRVREAAARAAGRAQVERLAALLLGDPAGDVRHAAADTLGKLGHPQLADVLVAGLEDRDAIVRAAVIRALERVLTPAGAIRRLTDELQAEHAPRRRAGLYALAQVKPTGGVAAAAALAEDPDPEVRIALVQVAETLLLEPAPVLRRLAADADPAVRHGAQLKLL